MKTSLQFIAGTVTGIVGTLLCMLIIDNISQNKTNTVVTTGPAKHYEIDNTPSTLIRYFDPKGQSFELVSEKGGITLRLHAGDTNQDRLAELEQLKEEVVRLTSAKNPVSIGKSGFCFRFSGKYPIWGPYQTVGHDGTFSCMFFAKDVTKDGLISAVGLDSNDHGYTEFSEVSRQ